MTLVLDGARPRAPPALEGARAARRRRGLGLRGRARPLPAAPVRRGPARAASEDPALDRTCRRAVSAEVMAAIFGEWRRHGLMRSGALVWFLRDLWAGAGWGVIDVHGRPKSAYWALRRAFAPRALFLTDEGTNGVAGANLINDGPEPVEGRLRITVFRDGHLPLHDSAEQPVQVEPRGSTRVWAEQVLGVFVDIGDAFRLGPPGHDLRRPAVARGGDAAARRARVPLRRSDVRRPPIRRRSRGAVLDAAAAAAAADRKPVRTDGVPRARGGRPGR